MKNKLRNPRRLIVDVSSLCWTALHQGADNEFGYDVIFEDESGRERKVTIKSAEHGFENSIDFLLMAWDQTNTQPKDTILVWESGNTKHLRQRMLPEYKSGGRSQPEEIYEEFNKLKHKLIETIKGLGGRAVTRPNMEGDDIIAFLVSQLSGEKVIMTQDGDLSYLLHHDDVSLFRKGEWTTENPYGPFDPKLIPIYKALVGDTSDRIPGAPRFGAKAWDAFLITFGEEGAQMVGELIEQQRITELESNIEDFKPLAHVVNHHDKVYASYQAAKLYPELVENIRLPLQWDAGYCKLRSEIEDERLRKFGGVTRIVHKGNFLEALDFLKKQIKKSEFIALDLETYTSEESQEWLLENDKPKAVDVIGSKVVSMGLTFGANQNYNLYFTLDHTETEEIKNISREQFEAVLQAIATDIPKIIHNVAFELPVLYLNFGKLTDQIFINPCFDTAIAANYVNENIGQGLKFLSKHYFDYDQTDYDTVTTKYTYKNVEVKDEDGNWVTVEEATPYRVNMKQLTAEETLAYGSDDTIMTSALWTHFLTIMELEHTDKAFFEIEEKSAYVSALGFAQGTPVSLERLRDMEREDDELERKSWEVLNELLIKLGWEGTQTPVYTAEDLTDPKMIKEIFLNITGEELVTRMRTPDKIYTLIENEPVNYASTLADLMRDGDIDTINDLVAKNYDNTPRLDVSSPKQVKELLYYKMNLPVNLINNATDKERQDKPDLAEACFKFNKILRGSSDVVLTDKEKELLKVKARTDDTAIEFALTFDVEPNSLEGRGLKAFGTIKEIATRRSLFYKNYRNTRHWNTGMLHSSVRQCSTVTRRHSMSFQNLQQMPKPNKGRIRDLLVSRYNNGLIISADLSGAELRLGADLSKDANLLACFVGDNKKDMHSLTASSAMRLRWGHEIVDILMEEMQAKDEYDLFLKLRQHHNDKTPEDPSTLRGLGKNTNFASSYGGSAAKLAELLIIPLEEAEQMLQAKFDTYPRYEEWKLEIEAQMEKTGYALTYKGARRHLRDAMLSENKWERSKAQRQGPNFMIQGSCGEALRLAMCDLWDSGILWNLRCNFIAPVHDELVLDSHPEDAFEVAKTLHRCMVQEGYMEDVPFVSSLSIGTSFYDQPEVEFPDPEVFDDEKVKEAIAQAIQRHVVVA